MGKESCCNSKAEISQMGMSDDVNLNVRRLKGIYKTIERIDEAEAALVCNCCKGYFLCKTCKYKNKWMNEKNGSESLE